MIIKTARLSIDGVNITDRPTVTRTRTGAWLVKGWGPTRRYSTRRQASRAAMVRRRHRRGGADLQIDMLRKIPGVVSATVRFNLPESVEILGTVQITVLEPIKLPSDDPVHWCDWADQPEVRIYCTKQGSTPDSSGEFRTERGDRYTFNREEATCPRCRP